MRAEIHQEKQNTLVSSKKKVHKFCTPFFNSPILKTKHILQFFHHSVSDREYMMYKAVFISLSNNLLFQS
jgi:hypothetical protein